MAVIGREEARVGAEGVRLPPGWHTLKITEVKRFDSKTDASKLPAIVVTAKNDDDIGVDVWLRQERTLNGFNERTWDQIANLFDLDWQTSWEFEELLNYFNQKLVGEMMDCLITHTEGKDRNAGRLFVNVIDFAHAGEGEDKDKKMPARLGAKK